MKLQWMRSGSLGNEGILPNTVADSDDAIELIPSAIWGASTVLGAQEEHSLPLHGGGLTRVASDVIPFGHFDKLRMKGLPDPEVQLSKRVQISGHPELILLRRTASGRLILTG